MSYRAIAAFPVLFVVAAMAMLAGFPPDARAGVAHVIVELVKTLALIGLTVGALSFSPGDYMRRGWGLCAACYAILLARDAWLLAAPPPVGLGVETARALLILLANASIVAGIWTLARAWQVAGLGAAGGGRGAPRDRGAGDRGVRRVRGAVAVRRRARRSRRRVHTLLDGRVGSRRPARPSAPRARLVHRVRRARRDAALAVGALHGEPRRVAGVRRSAHRAGAFSTSPSAAASSSSPRDFASSLRQARAPRGSRRGARCGRSTRRGD